MFAEIFFEILVGPVNQEVIGKQLFVKEKFKDSAEHLVRFFVDFGQQEVLDINH